MPLRSNFTIVSTINSQLSTAGNLPHTRPPRIMVKVPERKKNSRWEMQKLKVAKH
jgi:hypothetical protein